MEYKRKTIAKRYNQGETTMSEQVEQKTDDVNSTLLTKGDLGMASWALAQMHNHLLDLYDSEEQTEISKEQLGETIEKLGETFIKFDALFKSLTTESTGEQNEQGTAE